MTLNALQTEFPRLTGPYLGHKPPGAKPEIFAPGLVSLEASYECCRANPGQKTGIYWVSAKIIETLRPKEG